MKGKRWGETDMKRRSKRWSEIGRTPEKQEERKTGGFLGGQPR